MTPHATAHDPATRAALLTWYGAPRSRERTGELFLWLHANAFPVLDQVAGMTDAALRCYVEAVVTAGRDDAPAPTRAVCPSPMCRGRGWWQAHPIGEASRCGVCAGTGVVAVDAVAQQIAA